MAAIALTACFLCHAYIFLMGNQNPSVSISPSSSISPIPWPTEDKATLVLKCTFYYYLNIVRPKELEGTVRKGWFATHGSQEEGPPTPQGAKGEHQGQSGERGAINVNKTFILVFNGKNGQDRVSRLSIGWF